MTGRIRHVLRPVTADPYLPGHGDPTYDVTHYDVTIDYKLDGNQLRGKARIEAVALEVLSGFTLDLDPLQASKVSIEGVGVAKSASHRGKLVITTKTEIAAGQRFTVAVSYAGSPKPIDSDAGEAGWEELADGVLVAGQPGGAPTWFPCNDRPSSKASYRLSVTVPNDYHVVANGELVDQRRKSSVTTWVYEQRAPMATYLATVQIGRYVVTSLADKPVTQRMVAPKELAQRFTKVFGQQAEMMELFCRLFGPYPFDDYTVVVTADELEIPLEAQGLSIFGGNFEPGRESARLVAHELAHQWFGNSLTVGRWQDIWLHEGFACYAEWLWSEESGEQSTQELAVEHWERLSEAPQDIVIGDPGPELMFDDRVYKRGALTLHAIRLTVGDDAFFATLSGWTAAKAHGTVSSEEFVAFVSERAGQDLRALCEAWLMKEPLPGLPTPR